MKRKNKHVKKAKKLWEIDTKPCGEESPYRKYLEEKGYSQDGVSVEPPEANPDVLAEATGLYPPKDNEFTELKTSVIKENWNRLSTRQKQVLQLLSEANRTFKDVASILKISKGSVQTCVERAREIMSKSYEKEL